MKILQRGEKIPQEFLDDSEEFLTDNDLVPPTSADFRDGKLAEGKWREGHLLYEQVAGQLGVYLVVTDLLTGKIIRDDRPWQMKS